MTRNQMRLYMYVRSIARSLYVFLISTGLMYGSTNVRIMMIRLVNLITMSTTTILELQGTSVFYGNYIYFNGGYLCENIRLQGDSRYDPRLLCSFLYRWGGEILYDYDSRATRRRWGDGCSFRYVRGCFAHSPCRQSIIFAQVFSPVLVGENTVVVTPISDIVSFYTFIRTISPFATNSI